MSSFIKKDEGLKYGGGILLIPHKGKIKCEQEYDEKPGPVKHIKCEDYKEND